MSLLRHVVFIGLAVFCFAAAAGSVRAEGPEVLVPESLTDISCGSGVLLGERRGISMSALSTTGREVILVGKIDKASGVTMEISNNNRVPITPAFHENYFHAKVVLSLGVNMVEVRWKRGDGPWNTKMVSLFRSSKLEGGITSNYPSYVFHTEDKEKNCEGCHRMGLTQEEIETGMERGCLGCHGGLTGNVYVHGPVAVGICTVCHEPESSPNKYRVNDTDNVLCYGCHTDRKDVDDSRSLLHGPVGAGLCTICHDPHGSPFEYQLVKSRTEICILCHQEDYDRWIGQESLHPPFRKGDCAGCHDPHSSDVVYNLKAPRADICALCHEIPVPGHLHPVGVRPQFALPEDFPLDGEGRTMCLTCHDPHGASGPGMTRGMGCDGCHPK